MTVPPSPRHLVSGGCRNGDHTDEAEEDEANPDKEEASRRAQGRNERFQELFWGAQRLYDI